MPLIQRDEIANLINLFNSRGIKIYHACQYKDFKTYLEIGGIPSRNLLQTSGLIYTGFETDEVDKDNQVWDKVFANLSDFSLPFAQWNTNEKTASTPNPYGPILFILEPDVLRETADIAICLRSAGAKGFDRGTESLGSSDEVNRIFLYSIEDAPYDNAKSYIKFAQELQREFDDPRAMKPELSCSVEGERLSFNNLIRILVDPYTIGGQSLTEHVRDLKHQYQLRGVVWERFYRENRQQMMQELATMLLQRFVPINEVAQSEDSSEALRNWATRIIRGERDWQYDRFAEYLRSGTILELHNEA